MITPALLQQMTQNMVEGLFIQDTEGRLTFLNREAERLLGWSSAEILGRNIHELIHYQNRLGEPVLSNECPVHKCLQCGETFQVDEDVFTHRNGHLIPVSFIASPICEDDHIIGSVTIFQDLARKRQVEREIKQARDLALEASRLKSEFLANMSHEIRTPLNGIIGMTDLLLDTKINKVQKELAGTVKESAQALLTMLTDILDLSQIEAGKMEIKVIDFKPLEVVEEVAELMASQAQNNNLDLLTEVANKIPMVLRGDPAKLRQTLITMVANALKFTKKGEVVIRATLREKTKKKAVLRFSVTDTGVGIPKAARGQIFQPFRQADGSSTRQFGGAGLGLTIANRLVELMGGEIGFESKKNKGSTFWFTVPLDRAKAEEEAPASYVALAGAKVLVMDSHPTSQTILQNHLLGWNMKVTGVENLTEAMASLEHESQAGVPYDVVIVDHASDPNNHLDFGRQVIDSANFSRTALILLTSLSEKKQFDGAQKAGYISLLVKPIRRNRLQNCLLGLFRPEAWDTSEAESSHSLRTQPLRATSFTDSHPEVSSAQRLILLAEDNVVNQKVTQGQLNRLGYPVHTVANGREAVHAVKSSKYALVLMDCQMPVMDGVQATKSIRDAFEDSGGPRIPVIALTANVQLEDRSRCLSAGMDDFLSKPVAIEELDKVLRKWIPSHDDHLPVPTDAKSALAIEVPKSPSQQSDSHSPTGDKPDAGSILSSPEQGAEGVTTSVDGEQPLLEGASDEEVLPVDDPTSAPADGKSVAEEAPPVNGGSPGDYNGVPVIEIEELENHFGDDRATVVEFLDMYTATLSDLMGTMATTLENADTEVLLEMIRELKEASSNVGAMAMVDLSERLKQEVKNMAALHPGEDLKSEVKNQTWGACRGLLDEMESLTQKTIQFVDHFKAS
ncbi:MAG: response regulator [Magnetococcales bacterium]|nr:response regulator [Magnetococcales bacterium]